MNLPEAMVFLPTSYPGYSPSYFSLCMHVPIPRGHIHITIGIVQVIRIALDIHQILQSISSHNNSNILKLRHLKLFIAEVILIY